MVTGASAGLGAALAKSLASKGLNIVACAGRIEKLQELRKCLSGLKPTRIWTSLISALIMLHIFWQKV